MSTIYVSAPYSAPTQAVRQANVNYAMAVAKKLAEAGHYPVVPHLSHYLHEYWRKRDLDMPHEFWMNIDLALLAACDAIIMLPGWRESRGCCEEYDVAEARKMQILNWDEARQVITS